MSRILPHPTREQIELPGVMDCLSDPIRLAIVYNLAKREKEVGELRCGDFYGLSGKSNLAYHFAKLREAGLMETRAVGTARLMKLRREDLESRFPVCWMRCSHRPSAMPSACSFRCWNSPKPDSADPLVNV